MEDISVKEKLMEVLKRVNPTIEEGKDLIEAGLVDSFEVVNIIMEIEEAFDIEIDPDDVIAENFRNTDSILNLIEKSVKEGA